ncbi:hypothetical protein CPB83DRAFT_858490 [Crepidotus variabilis]|uniref:Polyketide cyclase/dehydrase n=1 Tax=Crepidotus variabilis TaxID=179855 RepID=A0A9P6EBI4_9AGAR|nr:hypothetical protein CPB83DRAFT_858490 [Crepidotus variabilis]
MAHAHLPPAGSDYVFSVTGSSLIDAPREKVWSILMDLPTYSEWNTFVYLITLTDASKTPLADQTPAVGKHLYTEVHMARPKVGKPTGIFTTGSAFVTIDSLDHANFQVSWSTADMPYFLLHTTRWQSLSVDENTGQTKYTTTECFGGFLAYLVQFFVGSKLRVGFQAAATSLKARAEQK